MVPPLGHRVRPLGRVGGIEDLALARVRHGLEVAGLLKVRVRKNIFDAVHSRGRDVGALQQRKPLRGAPRAEDFAEKAIDVIDVFEALAWLPKRASCAKTSGWPMASKKLRQCLSL